MLSRAADGTTKLLFVGLDSAAKTGTTKLLLVGAEAAAKNGATKLLLVASDSEAELRPENHDRQSNDDRSPQLIRRRIGYAAWDGGPGGPRKR